MISGRITNNSIQGANPLSCPALWLVGSCRTTMTRDVTHRRQSTPLSPPLPPPHPYQTYPLTTPIIIASTNPVISKFWRTQPWWPFQLISACTFSQIDFFRHCRIIINCFSVAFNRVTRCLTPDVWSPEDWYPYVWFRILISRTFHSSDVWSTNKNYFCSTFFLDDILACAVSL